MGCVPSKKRVERQQYTQELEARARATWEEATQLLNEFSRDLDERHEKRKRDARDAKATAYELVKSAVTPEEKAWAAKASADADDQVARVARIEKAFAENQRDIELRRMRRLGL
jgi:hypothetical protein